MHTLSTTSNWILPCPYAQWIDTIVPTCTVSYITRCEWLTHPDTVQLYTGQINEVIYSHLVRICACYIYSYWKPKPDFTEHVRVVMSACRRAPDHRPSWTHARSANPPPPPMSTTSQCLHAVHARWLNRRSARSEWQSKQSGLIRGINVKMH